MHSTWLASLLLARWRQLFLLVAARWQLAHGWEIFQGFHQTSFQIKFILHLAVHMSNFGGCARVHILENRSTGHAYNPNVQACCVCSYAQDRLIMTSEDHRNTGTLARKLKLAGWCCSWTVDIKLYYSWKFQTPTHLINYISTDSLTSSHGCLN